MKVLSKVFHWILIYGSYIFVAYNILPPVVIIIYDKINGTSHYEEYKVNYFFIRKDDKVSYEKIKKVIPCKPETIYKEKIVYKIDTFYKDNAYKVKVSDFFYSQTDTNFKIKLTNGRVFTKNTIVVCSVLVTKRESVQLLDELRFRFQIAGNNPNIKLYPEVLEGIIPGEDKYHKTNKK